MMVDEKLYNNLIKLLCERYDYHVYAADILESELKALLNEAMKTHPSISMKEKQFTFKAALSDFFEALYQRVFIFEENEQLRVVKHYDADVSTEREDRRIHAFRQDLLDYRIDVDTVLQTHALYEFSAKFREFCENALRAFNRDEQRRIIRDQFRRLFELDPKDMIVFLDRKLFIRRFTFPRHSAKEREAAMERFFAGQTFIESFWNDIAFALEESFHNSFHFYEYKIDFFKERVGEHFLRVVDRVISQSINVEGSEKRLLVSATLQQFWPHFFEVCALELMQQVDKGNNKAIKFLKLLLNDEYVTLEYNRLYKLLKQFTKVSRQLDKKELERKKSKERCLELDRTLIRSEADVRQLDQKRRTLMDVIAKVEKQIETLDK